LSKTQWDSLRKSAYKKANWKCEICGKGNTRMEAHEIWDYDDEENIQSLKGIICLCEQCHKVKHFGRTQTLGKEEKDKAIQHMMKVNGWTFGRTFKHIGESVVQWNKRECFEWEINIDKLKDLT